MPALDDGTPLFVQIAEQLADDIVDGVLAVALMVGGKILCDRRRCRV